MSDERRVEKYNTSSRVISVVVCGARDPEEVKEYEVSVKSHFRP